MGVVLEPLSECAITIRWGRTIDETLNQKVLQAMRAIEDDPFTGFVECVPAYASLTVYYDPLKIVMKNSTSAYPFVRREIRKRLDQVQQSGDQHKSQVIEVPVCYEGEFAPDLSIVAEHSGLSPDEVIRIHTSQTYLVYMIGFAPGFPYLGGLDARIATPRRSLPRQEVAAGSVGIAGEQTGIYPFAMPGGWQIIGRTPLTLFDVNKQPPTLVQAGDSIRFVPVSRDEYERLHDA